MNHTNIWEVDSRKGTYTPKQSNLAGLGPYILNGYSVLIQA